MNRRVFAILVTLAIGHAFVPATTGEEVECLWAQRALEDSNGADPAHYPPDRLVDVRHIKLDLDFEDLQNRTFSGVETYTVTAIGPSVRSFELDAMDLDIQEVVSVEGPPLDFQYDGERLVLEFSEPLSQDVPTTVAIRYRCVDPKAGLNFFLPDERVPNRIPQMHSQGQPDTNRYWFPCHDFPNERSSTEMRVTVPSGFTAISNGELVDVARHGDQTTFHWRQELPHAAYLVTLVIGEFATWSETWHGIPVRYYVAPDQEEAGRRAFLRTTQMLDFFSERFGVEYPYAQYAQVCVNNFGAGGMENTSATTLFDGVPLDERAAAETDMDGLIAHELAHQWFGDLITCKSWAHTWLNEGFATFGDDLWLEHRKGKDELQYELWKRFRRVAANDKVDRPGTLILRNYENPWEPFRQKGSLPYSKGSSLLQMLRHQLGEDAFWRGLQRYVRTYQNHEVETADFRKIMEQASGQSLGLFFDQWARRPGVPHLNVDYAWDHETGTAIVRIEQTQRIDDGFPAFEFPLELYFQSDGTEHRERIEVRRRHETFRRAFAHPPEMFCVDPGANLLESLICSKPNPMWLRQLRNGPTVASRSEAASYLASRNRPEAVEALADSVRDAGEFWGVRVESAHALGQMHAGRARDALLTVIGDPHAISVPEVRHAVVEALGKYRSEAVTKVLINHARKDPSYMVEEAATGALGDAIGMDEEVAATLIANAARPSHRDKTRIAAVGAIAKRQLVDGIEVCFDAASYGQHDRTRPHALEALAKLADEEPQRSRVRQFLIDTLNDPERRAREAAPAALGELGDREAIAALERLRDGSASENLKERAQNAIERILKQQEEPAVVDKVLEENQKLRDRIEALEERLEDLAPAARDDED